MSLTTHSNRTARLPNTSLTLCAMAVATGLWISPVQAQQADEETTQETSKLERIEVTARKTVESLQETPVAITSIGAAELGKTFLA